MTSILAVEDEQLVRFVVVEALIDAGYTVLEAGDGEEALALLREGNRIDLILTDVRMPRLDGFALARAAREMHPHIPLIFMTGYTGSNMRPEFSNAEMLDKPFTPEHLLEAVKRTLAQ